MVRQRPDAAFIKESRVNLRAGPSIDEDVLTVLTLGTPVFPERDRGNWVLVRASLGSVGWIHRSMLRAQ
jgi:SH3-like domain-containing protein